MNIGFDLCFGYLVFWAATKRYGTRGELMARKYHLIILTVLAVLLIAAGIVFWVQPDVANTPASPAVDAPANTIKLKNK